MIANCKRHGDTEFKVTKEGWRRCKACGYDAMRRHQIKVKQTLVAEHGGCCVVCGYSRCLGALQFHHVDPATKEFSISGNRKVAALDKIRIEAAKCILVCANCHQEIEQALIPCPALGTVYVVPCDDSYKVVT